tara:strand:+ start:759 stop:1970 length:1212 start_codon:yes stop_codon:yes gene_type:complete
MSGPLDGYKIIELTSTVSGPLAGMILADQGADVIKVEPPLMGDLARFMGSSRDGVGAMFSVLNRNKRSVVLDLKNEDEVVVLKEIIKDADVLIENYRPGIVQKLGIDYDSVRKINPEIIYTSISGYGQTGPYVERKVYDPLIQATIGTASAQNPKKPEFVRNVIFDKSTGLTAAQSITAALLQKEKTGKGEYLPISMLEAGLYFLWPDAMWSRTLIGENINTAADLYDTFSLFETKDRFVAVILVADPDFETLCKFLECDLHEKPKFSTLIERVQNTSELTQEINSRLKKFDSAFVSKKFEELGLSFSLVNSLDEIHEDPQVIDQGSLLEIEHPIGGLMRYPKPPFKFSTQDDFPKTHSPSLGEHNREILTKLGVDEELIMKMEEREKMNADMLKQMAELAAQ